MIIADSSVIAAYILREEPIWMSVEEFILQNDVCTLDLAVKEALNAVWRHTVITKNLSLEVAREKTQILLDLIAGWNVVTVESQNNYLKEAFEIAITNRVTIYDALFIAQAKSKKAPLATLDGRQAYVAEKLGVSVIKLNLR